LLREMREGGGRGASELHGARRHGPEELCVRRVCNIDRKSQGPRGKNLAGAATLKCVAASVPAGLALFPSPAAEHAGEAVFPTVLARILAVPHLEFRPQSMER